MAQDAGSARGFQAGGAPDEAVVHRVLAGDTASFELLMRRHNQRVYRTIRAVLRRDSADVEDAMQQTYLHAYRALAAFEGASSFGTWLTRIALNVALGFVRRQRVAGVELSVEVDEMTRGARDEGPEDGAARSEAAALLERAVAQLRDEHRIVFVLREVEQLSTAETAEALELSEENVKVRLHRARLALREILAGEVGQSAPQAFAFLAPRCDRVVHSVLSSIGARPRTSG
ncbi:RNA polymerase sigma factor [Anaeromyxobacter sp. Fw109-5]|uniref:RNA polymerase sigma factor n=1 Tax=Anaeromyxobacter sp. (strain Fw109-5) TaxID=404589 RepID=UPI0000ED7728|nr:RNA polymerase sigma factor [Anaeromyxobacter sp. Fw109-5]ABS24704.1 RNA polymerase, sigma-24 subunit, ECF subfamily [Anaeromyxobacter sp. Fw109-5]